MNIHDVFLPLIDTEAVFFCHKKHKNGIIRDKSRNEQEQGGGKKDEEFETRFRPGIYRPFCFVHGNKANKYE